MFKTIMLFLSLRSISPYVIMSHCPLLMKNGNFYDVWFLYGVNQIKTVSHLFTMLSTIYKRSSPSCKMVYIAIILQELLPFVHEISPVFDFFVGICEFCNGGGIRVPLDTFLVYANSLCT